MACGKKGGKERGGETTSGGRLSTCLVVCLVSRLEVHLERGAVARSEEHCEDLLARPQLRRLDDRRRRQVDRLGRVRHVGDEPAREQMPVIFL